MPTGAKPLLFLIENKQKSRSLRFAQGKLFASLRITALTKLKILSPIR
jgi:hypothetical protein